MTKVYTHEEKLEIINGCIKKRTRLKKEKKYEEADKIREVLLKCNVILEDTLKGTTWKWK